MAIVKVKCKSCGEIDLTVQQVILRRSLSGDSYYVFTCVRCGESHKKELPNEMWKMLVQAGVQTEIETPKHDGPPLTRDDLLNFHILLDQPDWFTEVERLVCSD